MLHFFVLGSSLLYSSRKTTGSVRVMLNCIPFAVALGGSRAELGRSAVESCILNLEGCQNSSLQRVTDIAVAKAESPRRIPKGKSLKFKTYEASTSNTVAGLGNGHLTESINKKIAHGLARAGYKAIYTRWYYPRLIIARPISC